MNELLPARIDRREFLRIFGAGAAAAAVLPSALSGRALSNGPRPTLPNLLIIHTDQQSPWTVSSYPRLPGEHICVETPNIDSLGQQGARLDNFFVNSALCTPSRGCLMTARYPDFTNTWDNHRPLSLDEITLAQALRDAGYDTGYVGKWHLSGEASPGWGNPAWEEPDLHTYGFSEVTYLWNYAGHFKTIIPDPTGVDPPEISWEIGDESSYPTDFCARKAVDFLTRPRLNPFFFMISFMDPHNPYACREPYASQYDPADMFLPPTLGDADPQQCRELRAQYCGMVKNIDDRVGEILAALQETGQYENTIVVFTSDHGDYMGEHGMYAKDRMFETVYRVPFYIRWPGQISPGTIIPSVISTVDVHPTLLTLLGIAANERIQGKDASHLLLGQSGYWEDAAFQYQASRRCAGIITPEWHLFVSEEGFTLGGVPPEALFDRLNDPWEMCNLFDCPAHQEIRDMLLARLLAHHIEFGTEAMGWLSAQYGETAGIIGREPARVHGGARLEQNHPNPFRSSTHIRCDLSEATRVRVAVYSVGGRCLKILFDGRLPGGRHTFRWDGRDRRGLPVGAGVYRCELATDRTITSRLLICAR